MSVNCLGLYQEAMDVYGRGAGSDKFQNRFIRATNRALDELSICADLATKHSHISSPEDTISTLDDEYEWILVAGINYYLARTGQRPADPNVLRFVYGDTAEQWERGRDEYVANRWNETQATDSNSVMMLGYLG